MEFLQALESDVDVVRSGEIGYLMAIVKKSFLQEHIKLLPEEYRVRKKIDEKIIEILKESIEISGVKVPIILDSEGWLIDGYHRWFAIQKIDKDIDIPIVVLENVTFSKNPLKAIALSYKINLERIGGEERQFKEHLIKETVLKMLKTIFIEYPEDEVYKWASQLKQGTIPYKISQLIAQQLDLTRQYVEHVIRGFLVVNKDEFVEILLEGRKPRKIVEFTKEEVKEREITTPQTSISREEIVKTTSQVGEMKRNSKPIGITSHCASIPQILSVKMDKEKLEKFVEKSVPITKSPYISKIVDYVPAVDIKKLERLTTSELKQICKLIDEKTPKQQVREKIEELYKKKIEEELKKQVKESYKDFCSFKEFWEIREEFHKHINPRAFDLMISEFVYEMFLKLVNYGVKHKEVIDMIRNFTDAIKSEDVEKIQAEFNNWLTFYKKFRLRKYGEVK